MSEEEREQSSRPSDSTQPDSYSLPAEIYGKQAYIPHFTDSESNLPRTNSQLSKPNFQPASITPYPNPPKLSLSDQLTTAKEQAQLKRIERGETIKAIDDWIGFITIKTVGISSLIAGGLEIIAPTLLTITLTPPFTPFTLVGMGLALLTGKQPIALAKNVLDTLAKDDKENDL